MQECVHIRLCQNSSGIKLSGMGGTVQAYRCLNSEQIDTLFTSVGVQSTGVQGVGNYFGPEAKINTRLSGICFNRPL